MELGVPEFGQASSGWIGVMRSLGVYNMVEVGEVGVVGFGGGIWG